MLFRSSIQEDIEAETVKIMGGMKHEKMINAEEVHIESRGNNGNVQFNEIGAGSVIINKSVEASVWQRLVGMFTGRGDCVEGNAIEADTIQVTGAKIGVLRGHHIEVGPACEIDLIEYTGDISVHDDARVGQIKKIEQ